MRNYKDNIFVSSEAKFREESSLYSSQNQLQDINAKHDNLLNLFIAPVHSIIGFSELLLNRELGDMPEEQLEAINHLKYNAKIMQKYLQDSMNLIRFQKSLSLREEQPQETNLEYLINNCVDKIYETDSEIQKNEITVIFSGPDQLIPVNVEILCEIIDKLLRLVIKYSKPGNRTVVSVEYLEGKNEETSRLELCIYNPKLKISKKQFKCIADPFSQTKLMPDKSMQMGLGLFFVKQIVAFTGGEISLENSRGKGGKFRITLPARCPEKSEQGTG